MQETNLDGAQLYEADLGAANLYKASVHKTNFYCANLSGATLIGTNMKDADLYGANMAATTFYQDDTKGYNNKARSEFVEPKGNAIEISENDWRKWRHDFVETLPSPEKISRELPQYGKVKDRCGLY